MSDAFNRDPKLVLITELCRELAKLGLNVGMSDARPAAVIRPRICSPLCVTVDASGDFFEWSQSEHRHPVTDSAGAAALISEQVKAQRSGPSDAA